MFGIKSYSVVGHFKEPIGTRSLRGNGDGWRSIILVIFHGIGNKVLKNVHHLRFVRRHLR